MPITYLLLNFLSAKTYPWQVAPQQSLFPFKFTMAKFKPSNYIYNLLNFPATYKGIFSVFMIFVVFTQIFF